MQRHPTPPMVPTLCQSIHQHKHLVPPVLYILKIIHMTLKCEKKNLRLACTSFPLRLTTGHIETYGLFTLFTTSYLTKNISSLLMLQRNSLPHLSYCVHYKMKFIIQNLFVTKTESLFTYERLQLFQKLSQYSQFNFIINQVKKVTYLFQI